MLSEVKFISYRQRVIGLVKKEKSSIFIFNQYNSKEHGREVLIMIIIKMIMESLILVIALSLDAFVACFAYGTNKIKIPFTSALVLTTISSLTLTISLFLGFIIKPYLPKELTHIICFIILFFLGTTKLFDSSIKAYIRKRNGLCKSFTFRAMSLNFILNVYADPEMADKDDSRILSYSEAISLALALSIDGLAVGLGAAIAEVNSILVIANSLIVGLVAVLLGAFIGKKVSEKVSLDLSWLSGVLLLILSFMKLRG